MADGSAARSQERQMPAQQRAAAFVPASFDAAARTVELVWSTGAPVSRRDWFTGQRYVETLSLDPSHVDLTRLNGGAPLLVDHRMYEVDAVVGVVERAWIEGGEGKALVRFSAEESAQPVFEKVREGVLRNVSITYQVSRYEVTEEPGALPSWLATAWQPMEISLLPVGADAGAGTRSAPREAVYPVQFETRGQPAPVIPEKKTMANETTTAGAPVPTEQQNRAAGQTAAALAAATAEQVDVAAIRREAVAAERRRVTDISERTRKVGLPDEVAQDLIARGVEGAAIGDALVDAIAARGTGKAALPRVEGGYDATDPANVRGAVEEALVARAGARLPGAKFEPTERARGYVNLSMLDMLAEYARASGEKIGRHVRGAALWDQLVQMRALSTSDFPLILANAGNKLMVKAYELAAPTYTLIGAKRQFNDFKPHSFIRQGDFPALLQKGEKGEFQMGAMSEAQNQISLATYGRAVGISRRIIVNDDMGAFANVPLMAGRRVADFNNATFWAMLAQNSGAGPTIFEKNMPTGRPLFHTVDHGNLASSGTTIDVANVGIGRAAMMKQTSIDGMLINVDPKYLVVSPDRFTLAEQFCAVNIVATTDANANPFKGRLTPVGDANLTGNAWHLFADPAVLETLVYGFLDGAEGPQLRTQEGFKVDGVELLVYEDFAVGAVDYRGAYRNPGA